MLLEDYLEERDERQKAFAEQSGVAQQTISEICRGSGCRVDTALKIVKATKSAVRFEDLVARASLAS